MKLTFKSSLLVSLLLVGALASASEVTVFVRPDGDNSASGFTQAEAVGNLQVAIKKALSQTPPGLNRRQIFVSPGTYLEQTSVVTNLPDEKPLIISGTGGVRPVFNGNGKGRSWLVLDAANGKPSRVTIEGIEVVNYVSAISFNGERKSVEASNSENIVRNNIFRDIGQIAFPSGKPSTAALRLVNSRNNQVVQNQFINIRNIVGCGALHSIYIAHYSSGNLIQGNTFDGGCGASVKTRDASNSNTIRGNTFINQSEPAFLDSFCDKDSREDCTKETSECPSWGNEFKDNSLAKLGSKAKKIPTQVVGSDSPAGCQPAPSRGVRLMQSNNQIGR